MKNISNQKFSDTPFVPGQKRKYRYYSSFKKKNNIIRYIEIIGVCIIVIAGIAGIFGLFN
jgi:hypothetical protein